MEFKDYYQTLGVTKSSTDKEIKQAFRKLARKFHPDVNPGDKTAEARFKEINEAYEVLGDPDKRRKYDELGANWRMYEQAQEQGQPFPGGSPYGFGGAGGSGGAWTINMGGGSGGYRTMSAEEMQELFGNEDPFSDFFRTFFGGGGGGAAREAGRGRGRTRIQKGQDIEHDVELTLEEAYHGATRRMSHQGGRSCAQRRRPHPRRRQGRLARPRGWRRRVGLERRRRRRSLPPGACEAPRRLRAQGRRPAHARRGAGDDGRARRRGAGADHSGLGTG